MEQTILGKPFKYWIELDARMTKENGLKAIELLEEVVELRGRINFYESRIKQMNNVREFRQESQ